ncbi:MAG: chemotaxis-specific protein-glutamate methyltransferase CheB [Mycobacteriales bacterium]
MNAAAPPVRVFLADDSRTSRELMRQLCADDPRLVVVGEAGDGRQAVEQVAALRPSIVVMDIEMPHLDGIEATRQIMMRFPTPILVVTAHHDAHDVALSLRAVQAGALSLAPKPAGPGSPTFLQDSQRFVRLVRLLAGVHPVRRYLDVSGAEAPASQPVPVPVPEAGVRPAVPLRAVGVAASTGGPAALYRLLELLPTRLSVPVLVVQHIADGFAPGLRSWLGGATSLPVTLAEQDEPLVRGRIYVAPDRCHLQVGRAGRVVLSDTPPIAGFRPSASVLFSSLAAAYGAGAAGVVLTGMGSDGLEGARALRQVGAPVLAQDAESSVVFGMPRAVAEAGLATSVGTIQQLAETLARMLPATS